jgi:DNA-binding NarL/FixJ family response regulator
MLAAEGLSNKEIARQTNVTEGTIKLHLHKIYGKLGVANRMALTRIALTLRARTR